MKFWLAAFVVLFAAVELFEWITQIGSLQPTGIWLILGGMGLAALSNAAHWTNATDTAGAATAETGAQNDAQEIANNTAVEISAGQGTQVESLAEKSADDSISFKVRPLKR